jgi:2,3-bisphosphoglycerate-independent phosphoglycerate mutase
VRTGAHSGEPVPFAMAGTGVKGIMHKSFSEANAAQSGFKIDNGFDLMEYFLRS